MRVLVDRRGTPVQSAAVTRILEPGRRKNVRGKDRVAMVLDPSLAKLQARHLYPSCRIKSFKPHAAALSWLVAAWIFKNVRAPGLKGLLEVGELACAHSERMLAEIADGVASNAADALRFIASTNLPVWIMPWPGWRHRAQQLLHDLGRHGICRSVWG